MVQILFVLNVLTKLLFCFESSKVLLVLFFRENRQVFSQNWMIFTFLRFTNFNILFLWNLSRRSMLIWFCRLDCCRFWHVVHHWLLRDLVWTHTISFWPVFNYKSRFLHYLLDLAGVWMIGNALTNTLIVLSGKVLAVLS